MGEREREKKTVQITQEFQVKYKLTIGSKIVEINEINFSASEIYR